MALSVDIVVPVYNEEAALPGCIARLTEFLNRGFPYEWKIIIADNASVDSTRAVAEGLRQQYSNVQYHFLPQKGRGRALRSVWLASDADIVSYMDVDLSTDLAHLPQMVEALSQGYHVAVGSRLSRESVVARGFKREFISRSYNLLIKAMFFTAFPDAQCGFKALTRDTVQSIVPFIENQNWFFDTELLILAAKRGYRIKSVPVKWDDDPNSSVNILKTATEDVRGLLRLRLGGIPRIPAPASGVNPEKSTLRV